MARDPEQASGVGSWVPHMPRPRFCSGMKAMGNKLPDQGLPKKDSARQDGRGLCGSTGTVLRGPSLALNQPGLA